MRTDGRGARGGGGGVRMLLGVSGVPGIGPEVVRSVGSHLWECANVGCNLNTEYFNVNITSLLLSWYLKALSCTYTHRLSINE